MHCPRIQQIDKPRLKIDPYGKEHWLAARWKYHRARLTHKLIDILASPRRICITGSKNCPIRIICWSIGIGQDSQLEKPEEKVQMHTGEHHAPHSQYNA
jgi:hypothetical protein